MPHSTNTAATTSKTLHGVDYGQGAHTDAQDTDIWKLSTPKHHTLSEVQLLHPG